MASAFSDTFATNDASLWTGAGNSGTSTTQSFSGGVLQEAANSNSDTSNERYIYKTGLGIATNVLWGVDFEMRHTVNTEIGYGTEVSKSPLEILASDGEFVLWLPLMVDHGLGCGIKNMSFGNVQVGSGTHSQTLNTWYYYRVFASNQNTTTNVADITFQVSTDNGANWTNVTTASGVSFRGAWDAGGTIDQIRFGHNHVTQFENARYTWQFNFVDVWHTAAPTYGAGSGPPPPFPLSPIRTHVRM